MTDYDSSTDKVVKSNGNTPGASTQTNTAPANGNNGDVRKTTPAPVRTDYTYGEYRPAPPVYHEVRYRNIDYRYAGGVYYRPYGDVWMVCRPPVGAFVPAVFYVAPMPTVRVRVDGIYRNYYYDDGVFFLWENDGYRAVLAPIGAKIKGLPSYYDIYYIDGRTYYLVDDVVFRKVGINTYKVVGYRYE
ncbi:MAG: hypothetical protein J5808_03540 [Paludibacteraceae bacterium]|nr:hypothetical protein [Paludibacteraceae bacterium]